MNGVEVTVPGGLARNGRVERTVRFRPLTGKIEQTLVQLEPSLNRPRFVTAVLCAVVDSVGDQAADEPLVASLCVADRQYLMVRLAAMLEGEQMWLKANCTDCSAAIDVEVRRCDLPVKERGQYFPQARIDIGGRTFDLRVPNGADQEAICERADEAAMDYLLSQCVRLVNEEPEKSDVSSFRFSKSDLEAIDEAIEKAAPAICDKLIVNCPECGMQQHAGLDHYILPGMSEHVFYDEIHTLASHYHWDEDAILRLPRERRRLYIGMINRSAGMGWQD